jgi:hypothetical protein
MRMIPKTIRLLHQGYIHSRISRCDMYALSNATDVPLYDLNTFPGDK